MLVRISACNATVNSACGWRGGAVVPDLMDYALDGEFKMQGDI